MAPYSMKPNDPYIDTSLGILRNLLKASTSEELRLLEAQMVFANEIEIHADSILRTNDLIEVCMIHRQLFQQVYDWAGQTRSVDIRRNEINSEFFLPHGMIELASSYVFNELSKENYLRYQDREVFVTKLASFYDQLNYIHPFREGNGRTQRLFWSRVASDAGYWINWDGIEAAENDTACKIAAEQMDTTLLVDMFSRIVTKEPQSTPL